MTIAFVAFAQRRSDEARSERGAYVRATVAARLLGVHVRTVRRWIKRGIIAGRRDGWCWYVYRDALRERTRPDLGIAALVAGIVD